MRHFYIFEIHPEIKKMTKEIPYELFHTLEVIYYQKSEDIPLNNRFLEQMISPIPLKDLDIAIFKRFKENYFYTKFKNIHSMHDVYRKENTKLSLFKTYMKLETNVVKPRFFEELRKYPNLFLCDFEEKDYFWLDSFSSVEI